MRIFRIHLEIILVITTLCSSSGARSQTIERFDWLLNNEQFKSAVVFDPHAGILTMENGLVKRSFKNSPDVACIEYVNLSDGRQFLRAVKPEALITINNKQYEIGGLRRQKEHAYLTSAAIGQLLASPNLFRYQRYTIQDVHSQLTVSDRFWSSSKKMPSGKRVIFQYEGSGLVNNIRVEVIYEIFDGLPLISKHVKVYNNSDAVLRVNRVVNEVLGMVEEQSAVVGKTEQMMPPQGIYFETNYAFNNSMRYDLSDQTTHWLADSTYTSQVNYDLKTPCLLHIYPRIDPNIDLSRGECFTSVKTYELVHDSYDKERRGLAVRRMYRAVFPWVNSNPIFMHLVSKNDQEVYNAIDQCVATGYEAVILSFGSHCDMEDTSAVNIDRWRKIAAYAHKNKIAIGSYALFSSRKISEDDDVINAETGKTGGTFFGNAPCFGSKWGLGFEQKVLTFFERTRFDIWENDGPYPGDRCASTSHPGHKGLFDSQWRQMEIQKRLYHKLNSSGVYINSPDWYFLDGSNKIAIGYREVNFALPRDNQKILNRQNIFDGTWDKTNAMGWGFVPLTAYHGGGPDAVLEPLKDHLSDYEQLMMQYYGAGVQACYRGPRLYDAPETKQTVSRVIDWYKKYRNILNEDLIHLRRADGRDWDGWMHVSAKLPQAGLVMLFNPLNTPIQKVIKLPLYYTGLKTSASIREKEGRSKKYSLNRDFSVDYLVKIPPRGYTWLVIER